MKVKSRVVKIDSFGGPELMKIEETEVNDPGPGQIRVKHNISGLNFIDIYQRKGLLAAITGDPPLSLGMEAAGVIDGVGENVIDFKPGDRVTHCMNRGSYCDFMLLPEGRVVKLPDSISDEVAAATTLQGLTAQSLLHASGELKAGQTLLVQAAAGGVGLLLCQWASHIGATVIGTVSTAAKAKIASENGCLYPIIYTEDDFQEKVMNITEGKGVDLVLDAVGKDTVEKGLACLGDRGRLVSYGMSSGPMNPVNVNLLRSRSASVAAAGLMTYTKDPKELRIRAKALFDMLEAGNLKVHVNQKFSIEDLSSAHFALEERQTTGSTILTL